MLKQNFFYYIEENKYIISDIDYCAKSERTVDIKLFDIANSKRLLTALKLWYLEGGFGSNNINYEYRAKWFCNYLSSFGDNFNEDMNKKALTNPTVRLLIIDGDLSKKIRLN